MAAHELPDLDELMAELIRLEREERDLSQLRRQLHNRIDGGYANEVTLAQERRVSHQRRDLHRRIDLLRVQLGPLMREPLS